MGLHLSCTKKEKVEMEDIETFQLERHVPWKTKKIYKMIERRKIQKILLGYENPQNPMQQECPICFLYYDGSALNYATCCNNYLCSDCLLQILRPHTKVCCPFCDAEKLKTKTESRNAPRNATQPRKETKTRQHAIQFATVQERKSIEKEIAGDTEAMMLGKWAAAEEDPRSLEILMINEAVRRSMKEMEITSV